MSRNFTRTLGVLSVLLIAATAVLPAQRRGEDRKSPEGGLNAAQRQELMPLFRLVDDVMKGTSPGTYLVPPPPKDAKDAKEAAPAALQPAPAEVPLAFSNHFLKAQGQQIFVPFTVQIEPGKIGASVAGYLRVAPKGATGLTPPAPGGKPSTYPFEDVYFTDLRATAGQPLKLTRAFAVPGGVYDVYVAIRERPVAGAPADTPVKAAVVKHELTVPDYHANELQTSSIIVADKIDQLTSPLAPDAQKERPYVLGDSEIVPVADLKFKKSEELQVIFQVYGATFGSDKKPDVTIEYMFHQKDGAGEKPFNKTAPQSFSAQTLPPNFDPAQGHQLVAGQAVPLASFPEGDFRLEIKITDNKAQKSLTRDVLFSVVPAS